MVRHSPLDRLGIDLRKRRLLPVDNNVLEVYRKDLEVKERADKMAAELSKVYGADEIIDVLVVMNGANVFYNDLMYSEAIRFGHDPFFERVSSYIGDRSSGEVQYDRNRLEVFKERNRLLIVEDIVDTGTCMFELRRGLEDVSVTDVRVVSLLDKPARRRTVEVEGVRKPLFEADLVGFTVPDHFVVGRGMDYDAKGDGRRNYACLRDVGVLKPKIYRA